MVVRRRPGVLPGTVLHRQGRCGKPTCRCHADSPRPHPPFHSWTRKVEGKTRTRRLSDEQLRDYQPWFDNARRLRTLTIELEQLSLHVLSHVECPVVLGPRSNRIWPGR
ncbi:MAG: hypothetical protein L0H64_19315, partial [Pseudonocardia sp.]|nr:hypothetical protein [Pseudonocardia sp.]